MSQFANKIGIIIRLETYDDTIYFENLDCLLSLSSNKMHNNFDKSERYIIQLYNCINVQFGSATFKV